MPERVCKGVVRIEEFRLSGGSGFRGLGGASPGLRVGVSGLNGSISGLPNP